MIIETRVFNRRTGQMVYMKPIAPFGSQIGAVQLEDNEQKRVEFDQGDPVMMKTSMLDAKTHKHLWEGDIIQCDIVTDFGSLIKAKAMIVYRGDKGGFIPQLKEAPLGMEDFAVASMEKIGDIFTTPELMKEVIKPSVIIQKNG